MIRVRGTSYISAECSSYLLFHQSPVIFLQESPCKRYICSVGEDEILFVWRVAMDSPSAFRHDRREGYFYGGQSTPSELR